MRNLPSLLVLLLLPLASVFAGERPNILIVTVDDMNCDSVGAFGCQLPGTTPNIDQLAAQGLRFQHAHVQVGNCFPSRNVLLSGRYPHNTGVEGFYQVKDAKHPHLVDLMKARELGRKPQSDAQRAVAPIRVPLQPMVRRSTHFPNGDDRNAQLPRDGETRSDR